MTDIKDGLSEYAKGLDFGMPVCDIKWERCTHLKIGWEKEDGAIRLLIPDFLKDAPEDALKDTLAAMADQMTGRCRMDGDPRVLPMRRYIGSREFLARNQTVYLARGRKHADRELTERAEKMMTLPEGLVICAGKRNFSGAFRVLTVPRDITDEEFRDVLLKASVVLAAEMVQ